MMKTMLDGTYKMAKRVVIGVVGFTLLLFGVIMLVTPGPGLAAIAAGLMVLAIEFAWARLWLKRVRERLSDANSRMRERSIDQHNGR